MQHPVINKYTARNKHGEIENIGRNINREDIFYYCTSVWVNSPNALGSGYGDFFILYYNEIKDDDKEIARTFMHELGHCIIEEIDTNHQSGERKNGDDSPNFHCNGKDCVMWWQGDDDLPIDYCDDCWKEIDSDGIGMAKVKDT